MCRSRRVGLARVMRSYLQDLVRRMTDKAAEAEFSKSVSWAAHREAERLSDRTMVGELCNHLQTEEAKQSRIACFFIIGKIGANLSDPTCAEILLAAMARERDKYVLSAALDSVRGIPKPASMDLSPIYNCLADPRWLVRHTAIQALEGCTSPLAEEHLLGLLSTTTDAFDQVYCHSTLNRIGTARAIPYLERALLSRKRDVRMSAESALAAIQKRLGMTAQPALPNRGPAAPHASSGVSGGLPSVS